MAGSQQRLPFGVASAVRFLRETRDGRSPRALSLAVGLSESYAGKLEAGKLEPSLHAFALLARELRMTPWEVYVVVMRAAETEPTEGELVGAGTHSTSSQPFGVTPPGHDGKPL